MMQCVVVCVSAPMYGCMTVYECGGPCVAKVAACLSLCGHLAWLWLCIVWLCMSLCGCVHTVVCTRVTM